MNYTNIHSNPLKYKLEPNFLLDTSPIGNKFDSCLKGIGHTLLSLPKHLLAVTVTSTYIQNCILKIVVLIKRKPKKYHKFLLLIYLSHTNASHLNNVKFIMNLAKQPSYS